MQSKNKCNMEMSFCFWNKTLELDKKQKISLYGEKLGTVKKNNWSILVKFNYVLVNMHVFVYVLVHMCIICACIWIHICILIVFVAYLLTWSRSLVFANVEFIFFLFFLAFFSRIVSLDAPCTATTKPKIFSTPVQRSQLSALWWTAVWAAA